MSDWFEKHLGWFFLAYFILFIGGAILVAILDEVARTSWPCDEFKNARVEDVPARCIKEYGR